eukprot:gene24238-9837_t
MCGIPGATVPGSPANIRQSDVCRGFVASFPLTESKTFKQYGNIYIFKDFADMLYITVAVSGDPDDGEAFPFLSIQAPESNLSSTSSVYAWWTKPTGSSLPQVAYNYVNMVPEGLYSCMTFTLDTNAMCNPRTSMGVGGPGCTCYPGFAPCTPSDLSAYLLWYFNFNFTAYKFSGMSSTDVDDGFGAGCGAPKADAEPIFLGAFSNDTPDGTVLVNRMPHDCVRIFTQAHCDALLASTTAWRLDQRGMFSTRCNVESSDESPYSSLTFTFNFDSPSGIRLLERSLHLSRRRLASPFSVMAALIITIITPCCMLAPVLPLPSTPKASTMISSSPLTLAGIHLDHRHHRDRHPPPHHHHHDLFVSDLFFTPCCMLAAGLPPPSTSKATGTTYLSPSTSAAAPTSFIQTDTPPSAPALTVFCPDSPSPPLPPFSCFRRTRDNGGAVELYVCTTRSGKFPGVSLSDPDLGGYYSTGGNVSKGMELMCNDGLSNSVSRAFALDIALVSEFACQAAGDGSMTVSAVAQDPDNAFVIVSRFSSSFIPEIMIASYQLTCGDSFVLENACSVGATIQQYLTIAKMQDQLVAQVSCGTQAGITTVTMPLHSAAMAQTMSNIISQTPVFLILGGDLPCHAVITFDPAPSTGSAQLACEPTETFPDVAVDTMLCCAPPPSPPSPPPPRPPRPPPPPPPERRN